MGIESGILIMYAQGTYCGYNLYPMWLRATEGTILTPPTTNPGVTIDVFYFLNMVSSRNLDAIYCVIYNIWT